MLPVRRPSTWPAPDEANGSMATTSPASRKSWPWAMLGTLLPAWSRYRSIVWPVRFRTGRYPCASIARWIPSPIAPAGTSVSRTSASMRLRSRRNRTLPKDLGPRPGEVHDRRFPAEWRRAPIDVEIDSVSELIPCVFAGARRRLTVSVRARRSDRTERLCEEAGDWMGWHAEGDQTVLRHNRLRRLRCRPQDDGVRAGEVLRAERLADC